MKVLLKMLLKIILKTLSFREGKTMGIKTLKEMYKWKDQLKTTITLQKLITCIKEMIKIK